MWAFPSPKALSALATQQKKNREQREETGPVRCLIATMMILMTVAGSVAEEVLLVETRNDFNERDDRLYLELDEEGLPFELVHRVYDIVMGVYRLEALTRGVALRQYRGKTVLKLQIKNFDPTDGGKATLTYLKSLIPRARYGVLKFNLQKHKGRWRLFQIGDDRPVRLLFFRANFSSVAGIRKPTGIRQIKLVRDRL